MNLKELFDDYQNLPEYSELKLKGVNQISLFGDQPMHIAATRGSVEEMSVLISNGAEINGAGEHGYTPLHDAVEQGHILAVKWLLVHGADKSLRNMHGATPVDLAYLLGEENITALLSSEH